MASPGNQHCANCISTLSFSIAHKRLYSEVHRSENFYRHCRRMIECNHVCVFVMFICVVVQVERHVVGVSVWS